MVVLKLILDKRYKKNFENLVDHKLKNGES